jgi:hypothetical protein
MQKLTEIIYMRVPHDLMELVREEADQTNRTLTATVRIIMEEYFTRKLAE